MSQPLSEPDLESHLPSLDGLRGLAILGVMFYHMTVLTSRTPLDLFYRKITECGAYGVDLFFVLSGFLITGILYDSKKASHFFRNFYARRTVRIFPLYYAVVFFCLVILPHIPNSKSARFGSIAGDEIWYCTYLSNFIIAYRNQWRHGILDISWTLSIEEQFYLLWPLAVFLFSRRTLQYLCLALIAIAILTRTTMVLTHSSSLATILITPSKFDALGIGALIALTVRQTGVLPWLKIARLTFPLALLSFILIFSLGRGNWDAPLMLCVGYTSLALTFGSFLLLSLPSPTPIPFLTSPPLRTLGKYSYAMYLFHLPLRGLLRDRVYKPSHFLTLHGSQLPGQLLFYPLAILFTLAAAMLSWHLYEKHFLKLKRFFPTPTAHHSEPAASL
jgi:peptidoglycan/LPS O-acetylase OafA/YrhL